MKYTYFHIDVNTSKQFTRDPVIKGKEFMIAVYT